MCFRSFWATLIFFTPPPTITTENEITPDLVWYMFWPLKKNFVQNFSPFRFHKYLYQNVFQVSGYSELMTFLSKFFFVQTFSLQISKIFKPKCVSGYSEQITLLSQKNGQKKIWTKILEIFQLKCLSADSKQKLKSKMFQLILSNSHLLSQFISATT